MTEQSAIFDRSPAALSPGSLHRDEAAESWNALEGPSKIQRRHRRGWLVRRGLVLADVVGLSLAFVTAFLVRPNGQSHVGATEEVILFLVTLPFWVVVAKLYGLYDRDEERTDHQTADDLVGVFHVLTVGAWLTFIVSGLTGLAEPDIWRLVTFWVVAVPLITAARSAARAFCRRRPSYLQRTVIVGAGDVGQLLARKIRQHPEYGLGFVGFVDAEPRAPHPALDEADIRLLGPPEALADLVEEMEIDRVVIAFMRDPHESIVDLARSLKDFDVQIDVVPRMFEIVGEGVDVHTLGGMPLVAIPAFHLSRSSRLMKRAMDLAVALSLAFLLLPLFVVIAVLIKLDSPGPVFFRQVRAGADGRNFRIYKFRTMEVGADERKRDIAHLNRHAQPGGDPRMFKALDDPRITRVGDVLRRFSLDELPQLINVVDGSMSLVGPRPLILDEHRHVADWARTRLDLKPGITGSWQVLGRSSIPFEEMVRLDYLYVTNWSLWNDIRLLFRTVPVVFRGEASA